MGVKKDVIRGPNIVAIIPTKLTSVRLPKKNLINLLGYPLFYYSVRVAQLCKNIDDIYVTSESDKVLEIATEYNCNIIKRPDRLSLPDMPNLDVIVHAYEEIIRRNKKIPEFIILLQPTHPLRFPEEIEKGINILIQNPAADIVMSVLPDDRLSGEIKNNYFCPNHAMPRNKSKEPKLFYNTGSFYIFRTKSTIAEGRAFSGNILPLYLSNPEFEIDIDVESDMNLAKLTLGENKDRFAFFWNDQKQ